MLLLLLLFPVLLLLLLLLVVPDEDSPERVGREDSSGGGGGADRLRAVTYTAIWTALVAYAFLYAPGHTPEGDAAVTQMTAALMTNPFSPDINQLYVVIFNALGVVPAIYAQLLLPGSKGQRLPAAPFVLASFAGGYFLLAPYLALRQYRPCVDEAQLRGLATLSTLRLGGVLTLVFALGLLQFAITNHVWTSFEEYMLLFRSQTLVHVSSIDLLLLSVVVWEPMLEDMRRRGMYTDGSRSANIRLAAFCAIPVLGPAVYLAVRPPLLAAED
ncbi:hypothetical protein JKP88DRAFT_270135 [Tribonema minus]|uniref:DUF2834 domain-containing protein n=1 Tax=Tribonema minus TaxID=303371 RepID=A0A836CEA7_9STRA|nr:hypothetical protein JKP88DRAFT_270135 [Tribonema minus]